MTACLLCCRWSSKFGEYPAGDPELHHVIGTLYAEGMTKKREFEIYRAVG